MKRVYLLLQLVLLASLSHPLEAQITNGLVAEWPMDGNVQDIGGQGHHGGSYLVTYSNNRFESADMAATFNYGQVRVLNESAFDFTTNFSLSVWFKAGVPGGGSLLSKQSSISTGLIGWHLFLNNGQLLLTGRSANDGAHAIIETPATYQDNNWHHAVAIRIGSAAGDWKVYVDGVSVGTSTGAITAGMDLTTEDAFFIGQRTAGNSFVGQIDDVSIYNRALSSTEVQTLFSGQPSVPICADMLFCTGDGVGIGTQTVPEGYKLAVKGAVISEAVKIKLQAQWPDYVFDKGYGLRSLEQVKLFIDQNNHLPDVPSAKEMKANGINVEEMNLMLLKKVEELTLYILAQDKKYAELKTQVDQLANQSQSKRRE